MISSDRNCPTVLVHRGVGIYGPFTRIVAGSHHADHTEAKTAMRRYGCNPELIGHTLEPASGICPTWSWATFYSCYDNPEEA